MEMSGSEAHQYLRILVQFSPCSGRSACVGEYLHYQLLPSQYACRYPKSMKVSLQWNNFEKAIKLPVYVTSAINSNIRGAVIPIQDLS